MENNDRFKFRAFHKPTKKMFDVYCFTDKEVFEDTIKGVGTSPTNPAKIEDCIFLQCLGVKDKNGKLIYEGDILATSNKDSQFDTWDKEQFGYTAVEWNQEFLCFNCTAWNFEPVGFDSVYSLDFVEVVGNIHENPELLEM